MSKDAVVLVLSCLGVAQALFLSVYLITKKEGNKKANAFLALVIIGLTIRVGKSVLNVYLDLEPWQRNIGISGILLTGPFLWFYGKILLAEHKKMNLKEYAQVVPFAIMVFFCFLIPNDGSLVAYAIYIAVFVHLAVYIGLSFRVFHRFVSKVHPQRAIWYRNLVIGVVLIWLFYMGHLAGFFSFYIGGAVFFSLLIYIFSFLFLQKHAFRLGKYNSSTLDKHSSEQLMGSVRKLFIEEDIFLDSSISLDGIADRLNVPARKLSQAINENEQKNFSDFVNGFRIEKAKSLLSDKKYRHEKIVAIAFDCGFGNVTTFNLAFKAKTNLTPSQYRKKSGIL